MAWSSGFILICSLANFCCCIVRGRRAIYIIMVNKIIDNPIIETLLFCTPSAYRPLNIRFISRPSTFATGPIMKVVLCDIMIPDKVYLLNTIRDRLHHKNYGTGSYPPLEKGLQRRILQIASILPLNAPYFSTASRPYSEHEGIYGHFVVFKGERYFLYNLIRKIIIFFINYGLWYFYHSCQE